MRSFEPSRDASAKRIEGMKKILKDFLSSKSNYDPEALKERIGEDSWLTDEYIQVLVKAGKPKEAIQLYVRNKQYQKAFNFGETH